jgi:hypothetical protein
LLGHDPVRSSGERIRVVLYEREQFHAATGLGHWAGGAFDGTLRLPVDDLGAEVHAWTRTLRHELAHAFLASQGGRAVPGWLNEGLAQWLEGDREVQLQGARAQVRGGTLFDLDELGGSLSALGDAAAIRRAYSQSLLLVDHLQRQYGERLVGELIDACATGSTPAARFEERLGFPLARVIDDLARELQ